MQRTQDSIELAAWRGKYESQLQYADTLYRAYNNEKESRLKAGKSIGRLQVLSVGLAIISLTLLLVR